MFCRSSTVVEEGEGGGGNKRPKKISEEKNKSIVRVPFHVVWHLSI